MFFNGFPNVIKQPSLRDIFMTEYNLNRNLFYCPSNPMLADVIWSGTDTNWSGISLGVMCSRIGYSMFFNNTSATLPVIDSVTVIPTKIHKAKSDWVLMADVIQAVNGAYNADFVNHRGNNVPDGGNILYVDGSAKWKPWGNFDQSVVYLAPNASYKYFAW